MSRAFLAVLASVVLLTVPVAVPASVLGASLSDQIEAARQRQKDLAGSIARSESLLRDLRQDQALTESAIRETEQELDQINADLRKVRTQIERARAALERAVSRHDALVEELRQTDFTLGLLEQELASGEEDLKARRLALGQRLAEAYRAENTTLLEQVFTAESFTDVLSQASAYLAYGDQDAALAQEITRDQQALDTLRLLTASTRLRTDQLRRDTIEVQDEIKARRAELEAARTRLLKLERKTERIQRSQEARYHELVKNEKEAKRIMAKQIAAERALQARIAGLVRAAQAAAARRWGVRPGSGNGFFDWPAAGTISGDYGCSSFAWYPPANGCAHFHDGIDIANGTGTPIYAPGDGVVAYVGYRADGAYVVVMGHAGGLESVLAHMLPNPVVSGGQFVKKGALIGYMGCTGFCTGPHVHWEVSRDFVTIDPRAYL